MISARAGGWFCVFESSFAFLLLGLLHIGGTDTGMMDSYKPGAIQGGLKLVWGWNAAF